jgi:hypothetical protein
VGTCGKTKKESMDRIKGIGKAGLGPAIACLFASALVTLPLNGSLESALASFEWGGVASPRKEFEVWLYLRIV